MEFTSPNPEQLARFRRAGLGAQYERLASQVESHRRVAAELARAEHERDEAIRAAAPEMSLRAIATIAGISHQRVAQIVNR